VLVSQSMSRGTLIALSSGQCPRQRPGPQLQGLRNSRSSCRQRVTSANCANSWHEVSLIRSVVWTPAGEVQSDGNKSVNLPKISRAFQPRCRLFGIDFADGLSRTTTCHRGWRRQQRSPGWSSRNREHNRIPIWRDRSQEFVWDHRPLRSKSPWLTAVIHAAGLPATTSTQRFVMTSHCT